ALVFICFFAKRWGELYIPVGLLVHAAGATGNDRQSFQSPVLPPAMADLCFPSSFLHGVRAADSLSTKSMRCGVAQALAIAANPRLGALRHGGSRSYPAGGASRRWLGLRKKTSRSRWKL
ncbi:hypothetical protein PVAP13_7KG222455, partial [Panicum virgatum]